MPLETSLKARCACGSNLSAYGTSSASDRGFTLHGTERVYERGRPFLIQHIALDLKLDTKAKSISGSGTLRVLRVDPEKTSITLDAVGFDIEAVELATSKEGKLQASTFRKASYVYDGAKLEVDIPLRAHSAEIKVRYKTVPRQGLYFLEPDEHVKDRPFQVWSQCQDEDARHIFPCHDKPNIKQTTELRVVVPKGWFALSNGKRVSSLASEKKGIFHYVMDEPHASYLFTLVAGEFSELEDTAADLPLRYYVPKGKEVDGKHTFARTKEMIAHFSKLLGVPYPWQSYSQIVVSDFVFGGMENTTATTMTEHILLDKRARIDITSDPLIAHELAHQWFGDYVTCRDWSHGWLNEGFATYLEHVDRRHHLGQDEYEYELRGDMEAYFDEARSRYKRPIVCQDYEAPIDIFDRHLYEKSACVLHLLRQELGDELFWKGVSNYLTRHAKGVVETRDLMRTFESVSGRSLELFFEQWLYRPGHPELEVSVHYEEGTLCVDVRQMQAAQKREGGTSSDHSEATTPLFVFDLEVHIEHDGRIVTETRTVRNRAHTFTFACKTRPKHVVVDPNFRILGEVTTKAPTDMLRHQLEHAKTARGRMLAALSLAKESDSVSGQALARVLANEKEFWGVRVEAADALGNIQTGFAFESLAKQTKTAHPKVRRAVARALGRFRTKEAAQVLEPIALKDSSYLVEAEAARALGNTRQRATLDTLVEVLDRRSWADVIRAGAIDGLAALRDERAIPHIESRTRYGVPLRARRAAILALPKLSSERRTRELLEDLLDGEDPYLRVDVVRALVEFGDPRSRAALSRRLDRELDGRVRRRLREALRDLGGGRRRDLEQLRDELETLRSEHGKLRERLIKLEERKGKRG